jgi:hypothetical protein
MRIGITSTTASMKKLLYALLLALLLQIGGNRPKTTVDKLTLRVERVI